MESLHYSDYNGNSTQEFPYWQPLIAIDIILYLAVILPSTLFWNLSVFTALIKSKLGNMQASNGALQFLVINALCGQDWSQYYNGNCLTRYAQILHMQRYKLFLNQSLRCILHCFFCTDNRLPELVTATNRQREETMEQLRKDHLLHWSKFSGWNVLVHCATGSANPSTSVIKSLPAVMHTEYYTNNYFK